MLIVEWATGTRATVTLKNPGDLAKELMTRIENLPFLVPGIIAVFPDDQDGVDGQLPATATECLGNLGIDLEAKIVGS